MTPDQLWNDRTFFTLLTDVWKARKDATLGPVRLGVLIDYMRKQVSVETGFQLQQGPQQTPKQGQTGEIDLSRPENRIQRDEEEVQKQAAGPVELALNRIVEAGKAAPGRQFVVTFDKGEGQAVQEIPGYLETFNLPFRAVENRGFSEGRWILVFEKK